jgi:hypothetical protein
MIVGEDQVFSQTVQRLTLDRICRYQIQPEDGRRGVDIYSVHSHQTDLTAGPRA